MIVLLNAVLDKSVVDSDGRFDKLCIIFESSLTLKMTTAQVVETSVTVNNSPIQDYINPTIILNLLTLKNCLSVHSVPQMISNYIF